MIPLCMWAMIRAGVAAAAGSSALLAVQQLGGQRCVRAALEHLASLHRHR